MKSNKSETNNNHKHIPFGFKQTDIGLIPEDWDINTIDEWASVEYGKANPKTEGKVPLVGSGGVFGYVQESLVDFPTLVIGRKGTAGSIQKFYNPTYPTDTTFYLKWKSNSPPLEMIYNWFLIHPLSGLHAKTTLPSIQKPDVEKFQFPLPPLPEQKKIAYVLSKIQQAIETQEKIIKTTQELKKALMQKLFTEGLNGEPQKQTEIGPIPESWEVKRIDEVYIFTCKPRNRNFSEYRDIPFIPMELIPDSGIDANNFILKDFKDIPSGTYFENGDLLLAKITPSFENGKQGIANINFIFGYATTEVIPIKGIPNKSDIRYLHYYLQKEDVRNSLAGKMEGSTGRQRLPKGIVQATLIPFPELEIQKEIVSMFLNIDYKIKIVKTNVELLKELFNNSLNQLMTGQIRVKDIEFELEETAKAVE